MIHCSTPLRPHVAGQTQRCEARGLEGPPAFSNSRWLATGDNGVWPGRCLARRRWTVAPVGDFRWPVHLMPLAHWCRWPAEDYSSIVSDSLGLRLLACWCLAAGPYLLVSGSLEGRFSGRPLWKAPNWRNILYLTVYLSFLSLTEDPVTGFYHFIGDQA